MKAYFSLFISVFLIFEGFVFGQELCDDEEQIPYRGRLRHKVLNIKKITTKNDSPNESDFLNVYPLRDHLADSELYSQVLYSNTGTLNDYLPKFAAFCTVIKHQNKSWQYIFPMGELTQRSPPLNTEAPNLVTNTVINFQSPRKIKLTKYGLTLYGIQFSTKNQIVLSSIKFKPKDGHRRLMWDWFNFLFGRKADDVHYDLWFTDRSSITHTLTSNDYDYVDFEEDTDLGGFSAWLFHYKYGRRAKSKIYNTRSGSITDDPGHFLNDGGFRRRLEELVPHSVTGENLIIKSSVNSADNDDPTINGSIIMDESHNHVAILDHRGLTAYSDNAVSEVHYDGIFNGDDTDFNENPLEHSNRLLLQGDYTEDSKLNFNTSKHGRLLIVENGELSESIHGNCITDEPGLDHDFRIEEEEDGNSEDNIRSPMYSMYTKSGNLMWRKLKNNDDIICYFPTKGQSEFIVDKHLIQYNQEPNDLTKELNYFISPDKQKVFIKDGRRLKVIQNVNGMFSLENEVQSYLLE